MRKPLKVADTNDWDDLGGWTQDSDCDWPNTLGPTSGRSLCPEPLNITSCAAGNFKLI